ncbi:MAG: class I SAM-dependent methyltransferase [Eubacteriales bacterium]|nr:class I SAM-dependent methyltransferase [Eubacteriales bacterium]
MEAYTGFAYVYDEYMDNIPYEEWGQYLIQLLKEQNIKPEAVLCDLGCGTGTVTRMLDEEGYECIGIDLSEDMLSIASERMYDEGRNIIYSCQDMRDFNLPYTVDAFVSIGDSMNYITSVNDLTEVFKCVNSGLDKGGVFIFDLKTIHFFRDILADNTYAENREDSAFIWDNYYNEEDGNNEYDLAVFIKNENGSFERFEENHYQHGFTLEEVRRAVEDAGLRIKVVYDAFTHNEPKNDSERLYYIIEK